MKTQKTHAAKTNGFAKGQRVAWKWDAENMQGTIIKVIDCRKMLVKWDGTDRDVTDDVTDLIAIK